MIRRYGNLLLVGLCGCLLLGSPRIAEATNGLEPIGTSTQSRGRGGADVAVGDSALSQIDNPATLLLHPGCRFDLAGELLIPDYRWIGPVDSAQSGYGIVPLLNFAESVQVNDDLAYGWAVYAKSGIAARFYGQHLLTPPGRNIHDRSDYENLAIPFNVAYRLTDQLFIGGGVRAEAATAKFRTVLGALDFSFERGYAFGGGFQAGLFYQASDTLSFGFGYRSPTWFGDLEGGDAHIEIPSIGQPDTDLGSVGVSNFRLPQKITAGAAWDANCWLKLTGEVRWINWSDSSFHDATVTTDALPDISLPLGYKDMWVLAVGADLRLDEHWKLSVGYNYGTEAISNSNLLPIVDAFTQHHVTTGLIYEEGNWWVGGGYMLGVTKGLEGSGQSELPGGPTGNGYATSRLSQALHSLFFGFGFSW